MALKDRLRRLRNRSSPTNSTALTPNTKTHPKPSSEISPSRRSPSARSTTASTGQATPAATQTPVAGISSADLSKTATYTEPTTANRNSTSAPLTNSSTIQEVLTARAAANASQNGTHPEKKKRLGLFRKKEDPYKDWPEDVYKPHEVPAPKYKRTPDPKHLENLNAYSFGAGGGGGGFGKLVRRLSGASGVSPGGSKWQSPFASRAGSRAPSRLVSAEPSRNPSIAEEVAEGDKAHASGVGSPGKRERERPGPGTREWSTKSLGYGVTMHKHDVDRVAEEEGEGEAGNLGLMSRPRTVKDEEIEGDENTNKKTDSKGSHDMPFTEEQLTQALTRATLNGNSEPRAIATPES